MAKPDSIPPPFDEPHTGARFRTTHWSLIVRAGQDDPVAARQALGELCRNYWYPLYAFVRRQGYPPADAEDLTQSFLATLLGKNYLADVRREKGKFRSFLLIAIKRFIGHEYERQHAQKRGGGRIIVSIDETAENHYQREIADKTTPETLFERSWALAVLSRVFAGLRAEYRAAGKEALFARVEGCLPGAQSQAASGDADTEPKMSEAATRMAAFRLRRRYGQLLRSEIAATVSSPDEIDAEIRYLMEIMGRA